MPLNIFRLSGSIDVDAKDAERALNKVDADAKKTHRTLAGLGNEAKSAAGKVGSAFNKPIRLNTAGAKADLHGLESLASRTVNSMGRAFSGLKLGGFGGGGSESLFASMTKANVLTGMLKAGFSQVTDAAADAWKTGIEYQKVLENATVRMDRFFSSAQQTKAFVADVEKFAAISPVFEMEESVTGAQRLLQMKFAANEVVPALGKIGDMVGGIGGNAQTIDSVTRAFSQMVGTGRIQADEMNQLTEANVPAWELLSKAIGKTEAETRKLVEAGRIDASRGVRGIISMGGEMFKGQSEKSALTLSGQESQFKSAYEMQLAKATKGNFDQLKQAYAAATQGLGTAGSDALANQLNTTLSNVGKDFIAMLPKVASGEYLAKGAQAVGAVDAGIQKTAGAIQKSGLADMNSTKLGNLNEALFGDLNKIEGPDGYVIRGVVGALKYIGVIGNEEAQKSGDAIGQGLQDGTTKNLQIQSPSKVMMGLGKFAAWGFADGFEQGKKAIKPISAEQLLKKQFDQASQKGYVEMIEKIAKERGHSPALGLAIASRETGLRNIVGDNGNGYGLFQVDKRTDPNFAASGAWKDPEAAIRRGFEIYEEKVNSLIRNAGKQMTIKDRSGKAYSFTVPKLEGAELQQTALGMYNSGWWAAYHKSKGRSPDAGTWNKNYSADVLNRAEIFDKFLSAAEAAPSLLDRAGAAFDALNAKLSSLANSAIAYAGFTKPAPLPPAITKAPTIAAIQQRPGDGASAKPFGGQILDGGGLSVDVKAKADVLTLSNDALSAAASLSQMSIPLKELPALSGSATEALKTTGSQAGQFADAILAAGTATGKAIDHLSHFKDSVASSFDDIFDAMLDGQKVSGKAIAKNLFKGFLSSSISAATGGQATTPGQALSRMLFGGGATSGATGGSVPATPGFAGGGGAADILNKAQGVGNLFSKGGALSKLPGISKVGGFLGKIPGLGKLGSLFGFGGGGGAAAGAAGAEGAAGAGGAAAMFSNPVTAAIAIGSMVAMPLIGKLFSHNYLKDYKRLVKGEYGINISNQVAQKIMETGQSKFGKEWPHREIETVRLPEVRDMIAEYAQGYMLNGANSKLFNSADYSDPFSALNQVKVGMLNGGVVPGVQRGYDHIPVMMDGGEVVISNAAQRRAKGGGWTGKARDGVAEMMEAHAELLQEVRNHLSRLQVASSEDWIRMAGKKHPDVFMEAVDTSAGNRSEASQRYKAKVHQR